MLKVGDKVKVREDLAIRQCMGYNGQCFVTGEMRKYIGEVVTISKINNYDRYSIKEDDNKYRWTEDMFDKIEEDNNIKELTFKEVVAKIKEGETWESTNYIIKCSHRVISIETKNGEVFNGIAFCDDILFTLQRKQYSFEEAFKCFEKGREIESVVSKKCFKIRDSVSVYIAKDKTINTVNDEIRLFTHNEIRSLWNCLI